MGLIEKIAAELGIDEKLAQSGMNYTVFDGHSAYFQGIKGIKSFSDTLIEIYTKNKGYVIEGTGLKIKKLYMGDIAVIGDIKAVRREN